MMDYFIPQAPYAEDQPHAHEILYAHVLHRGIATGALIGALVNAGRKTFQKSKSATSTATATVGGHRPHMILRGAGTGVIYGMLVAGAMTTGRMYGRDEIEWQDRSWRLLGNPYQNQVDVWSVAGMVAGAGAAAAGGAVKRAGGKALLGGVGLGGLVATGAMMGWRQMVGDPAKEKKEEEK